MPLTFLSHQAVVLPLKLAAPRWVSGTALVLGSMAPDVEYFLRGYPSSYVSHTLAGQVTFCLPVTLALFWIVTRIIAVPLAANIPPGGTLRLTDYAVVRQQPPGLSHWLIVAISALIGSTSHVVLDRLSGGWSTRAAPEYGDRFPYNALHSDADWIGFKLGTWVVLAIATLLMLAYIGRRSLVIAWAAERMGARGAWSESSAGAGRLDGQRRGPPRSDVGPGMYWGVIAACCVIAGVLGAIFRKPGFFMHQPATWVHIGLCAISGAFVGLVLASLLWQRHAAAPITLRGESQ